MQTKKKKFFQKFKKRFRFVLLDENNFKELWFFRLTFGNVFVVVVFLAVLLIVSGGVITVFTPLRHWIPGYPNAEIRGRIIDNSIRIDSLLHLLDMQNQYITNVQSILNGNIRTDVPSDDTSSAAPDFDTSKQEYDNLIREKVELEKRSSVSNIQTEALTSNSLSSVVFFPPITGVVSGSFNFNEQHYATDIVAKSSSTVCAAQSGTIISQNWTFEGGNVIQIQHSNNFVTVYKHNESFLKNLGDYVLVGEPIAILGNTGEYSTGPHLHFEMWHNGVPVNPEDFVSFN